MRFVLGLQGADLVPQLGGPLKVLLVDGLLHLQPQGVHLPLIGKAALLLLSLLTGCVAGPVESPPPGGAVSASSGAQRGFTLDGVRYHHILDPKTGYPADAGLLSVTVVCPSGLLADALSTACFVLGEEGAAALLAQFPQASALLLLEDGSLRVLGSLDFEPA